MIESRSSARTLNAILNAILNKGLNRKEMRVDPPQRADDNLNENLNRRGERRGNVIVQAIDVGEGMRLCRVSVQSGLQTTVPRSLAVQRRRGHCTSKSAGAWTRIGLSKSARPGVPIGRYSRDRQPGAGLAS